MLFSPSKLRNYATGNTLIDWLELFGKQFGWQKQFKSHRALGAVQTGDQFEQLCYNYFLRHLGKRAMEPYVTGKTKVDRTIHLMQKGSPVIYQAHLRSKRDQTSGIADFLVRSDYVNRFFTEYEYSETHLGSQLSKKWHYVVMDSKCMRLQLGADGYHLSGRGEMNKAAKLQLYIYNRAISEIQGYEPRVGMVLGAGYRYQHQQQKQITRHSSDQVFARPGLVEFGQRDLYLAEQFRQGCAWLERLHSKNAQEWQVLPEASQPELRANAKLARSVSNYVWWPAVQAIAQAQDDLTRLVHIEPVHRDIAHLAGVKRTRDLCQQTDQELEQCLDLMGFEPKSKEARQISLVVRQNRTGAAIGAAISPTQVMECTAMFVDIGWIRHGELELGLSNHSAQAELSDLTYLVSYQIGLDQAPVSLVAPSLDKAGQKVLGQRLADLPSSTKQLVCWGAKNRAKLLELYQIAGLESLPILDFKAYCQERGWLASGMLDYTLPGLAQALNIKYRHSPEYYQDLAQSLLYSPNKLKAVIDYSQTNCQVMAAWRRRCLLS